MGDIELELDGSLAPITVGNFVYLASQNFYDNTTFHRVIPDFMIQGGDPLSRDPLSRNQHGTGDPGYKFQDEINDNKIVRGAIAMANAGPNTNGSQFFIVTGSAFPHLDGKHTVFGHVTAGMDAVDAISQAEADARDNPIKPITINDVVLKDSPSEPALKVEDN
jgi:cyclophilin family peptidyl-prolyl cis-trans isomerase